jgi:Mg-chelatase subunit ChlD
MSSNSESKTQNVQRPTIFTFPLFDGVTAIKIATNVRQREASERTKEKVVIALDRSGSMHYVMSDVCAASVKIIRSLFDAKKTDVGFVAYNYETRWVDINPSNFLNTATAIKQIRPGGQTGFAILLTTIYSYLENVPADRPVTIFILTDGCETCSPQSEVNSSMKQLKGLFENRSGRSRVVTLGFTNRHDANFLTTLSNLGTHPGFFAYSEDSSDLSSTMNLVEKIMSINTIDGTLRIVAG